MKRISMIVCLFVVCLIELCAAATSDVIVNWVDPFQPTRTVTSLPVVFSYIGEPEIRMQSNENAILGSPVGTGAAIARLGTLYLASWNIDSGTSYNPKNYNVANPSLNYIRHLFLGFGSDGKAVDSSMDNKGVLTYSKGKTTINFDVKIIAKVVASDGTRYTDLASFTNKNPALHGNSNMMLKEGNYIEFWLVTANTYNNQDCYKYLSSIMGGNDASLTLSRINAKNIFQLVYRLNSDKNYTDRYYTSEIIQNPINALINAKVVMDSSIPPTIDWGVSVVPVWFAEHMIPSASLKQYVADMTISRTPISSVDTEVSCCITDSGSITDTFSLQQKETAAEVGFDLMLSRSGSLDLQIQKGVGYNWVLPANAPFSTSKLYVTLHKEVETAATGNWSDTLTISIAPLD